MSTKYPGGFITKNYTAPTLTSAPGVWTLEQQEQAKQAGIWPYGGPFNYIEDVFSTYLYTGNSTSGGTQTITNNIDLSTNGGLVWIKARSTSGNHSLYDTNRGAGTGSGSTVNKTLSTNSSASQGLGVTSDYLSAFSTTGFSVTQGGTNTATRSTNYNGVTYSSWTFRQQPKFFDVVTYTGNSVSDTQIAHNLGSTPGCVIIKRLDGASDGWAVWHQGLSSGNVLELNLAQAQAALYSTWFGSNLPTSTYFNLGTDSRTNNSGTTYVAYLFAHDAGGFGLNGTDNVISCGSYTGNGTTQDISLGYEPQWIMVKNASASASWVMFDTMRGWSLTEQRNLEANAATIEYNFQNEYAGVPFGSPTATGFSLTSGYTATNLHGNNYVYIAIRKGPMKVPTDATKVFTPVARSGTGAAATVTTNFPTDLILSMNRNVGLSSGVWDRLRGITQYLETTGMQAEAVSTNSITLLPNTAYVLGSDSATDRINRSGYTYANWVFQRAPSFFDEVCSAGTGSSNQARTHNLGAVPELIIVKDRTSGSANWTAYSSSLGQSKYLNINNTNAATTSSGIWGTTANTATTFYCADTANWCATVGNGGVFYLFATCPGVSKVGSYTGTGATQTIDCGFAGGARFVLVKRTDSSGDWYVWDTARGMTSGTDPSLALNTASAEVNANSVYTVTTGFQIVSTAAGINASGGTYIYLAIA